MVAFMRSNLPIKATIKTIYLSPLGGLYRQVSLCIYRDIYWLVTLLHLRAPCICRLWPRSCRSRWNHRWRTPPALSLRYQGWWTEQWCGNHGNRPPQCLARTDHPGQMCCRPSLLSDRCPEMRSNVKGQVRKHLSFKYACKKIGEILYISHLWNKRSSKV